LHRRVIPVVGDICDPEAMKSFARTVSLLGGPVGYAYLSNLQRILGAEKWEAARRALHQFQFKREAVAVIWNSSAPVSCASSFFKGQDPGYGPGTR
jgi:hypothetical protein